MLSVFVVPIFNVELSERTCNGIVSGTKGFLPGKGNLWVVGLPSAHFSSIPEH